MEFQATWTRGFASNHGITFSATRVEYAALLHRPYLRVYVLRLLERFIIMTMKFSRIGATKSCYAQNLGTRDHLRASLLGSRILQNSQLLATILENCCSANFLHYWAAMDGAEFILSISGNVKCRVLQIVGQCISRVCGSL